MNGRDDSPDEYIISKDLYLCEGCGEYKRIIIRERELHDYIFDVVILPFKLLGLILWKVIILPYTIYKHKKQKR